VTDTAILLEGKELGPTGMQGSGVLLHLQLLNTSRRCIPAENGARSERSKVTFERSVKQNAQSDL